MKALIYLLQVSACTGIFYAFYFLLLRRYTFFTTNRCYLIGTLLLSFAIPALHLPVNTAEPLPVLEPIYYVRNIQEEPAISVSTTLNRDAKITFDWLSALQGFYIAIATASGVRLVFTLSLFFRRIRGKQLMRLGTVKVLKGGAKLANSSFLNIIFVNDEELHPDELKQVIAHEMLHIKLMHSADRLVARLVQIILWFNPFAYFYIRSIEENHEFEVDRIIAGRDDKGAYAQLLFKLAVSGNSSLFHSFSKVPLKKRITMLFNKPTANMKKIIYVLILPVVVISCLAFANFKQVNEKLGNKPKQSEPAADTTNEINKYRQRIRRNGKEIKEEQEKNRKAAQLLFSSPEFKHKQELISKISGKTLSYKVVAIVDTNYKAFLGHVNGYMLLHEGDRYLLSPSPGKFTISGLLNPGDEVKIEPGLIFFGKDQPVVINPLSIEKDNKVIYNIGKEERVLPKYAFLYEANAVRFTDGKLTSVQKYPNGKWKSAIVVVDGGFKIRLNIEPSAPTFEDIKEGDNVRFRFVHEVKTGAQEYTVKDWVSLSNNIKSYGTKNPEYFSRFYAKL